MEFEAKLQAKKCKFSEFDLASDWCKILKELEFSSLKSGILMKIIKTRISSMQSTTGPAVEQGKKKENDEKTKINEEKKKVEKNKKEEDKKRRKEKEENKKANEEKKNIVNKKNKVIEEKRMLNTNLYDGPIGICELDFISMLRKVSLEKVILFLNIREKYLIEEQKKNSQKVYISSFKSSESDQR
jgi:hypothetical protein